MTTSDSDRRRATRFEISQAIEIAFPRETFFQAVGINVSATGLMCETTTPIDNYARVQLMLNLSYEGRTESINIEGVVMRAEKVGDRYHVGIKFTDMPEYVQEELNQYLASLGAESA